MIEYALSMIGSSVSLGFGWMALSAGGLLFLAFVLGAVKDYARRNAAIYCMLCFLILTAVANAFARSEFGVDFSFMTSRYRFVSLLMLAVTYIMALEVRSSFNGKLLMAQLVFCTAILTGITAMFFNRSQFPLRLNLLNDSALRWQLFRTGLAHPNHKHAAAILERALSKGFITVPVQNIVSFSSARKQFDKQWRAAKVRVHFEHILESDDYLMIDGYGFPKGTNSSGEVKGILLKSDERIYCFSIVPRVRPDVSIHYDQPLDSSGFLAVLSKAQIESGTYNLGLLVTDGGKSLFHITNKTIRIESALTASTE